VLAPYKQEVARSSRVPPILRGALEAATPGNGVAWCTARGMSNADVETLKRGYAALNRGDLSVVLQLLDPNIQWHEPAPSPEAGAHRGRDSFERFLRSWLDSFEDFRVVTERVVDRGDELVVVVRQSGTGRSSGLRVDARLAHVWTVADGTAVRWEAVADLEVALDDDG